MTKELISEARQEESIHDKLGDGFSEGSEERAFHYEHRDRYKRLADALETSQPSGDDREALIDVVKRNRSVVKRMSDGYPSVVFVTDETIADAILAAGFSRAAVPDAATEGDYHEGLEEGIKIGRAERDAALAAIERVRETLMLHNPNGRLVKEVLAALDGAPEPEWEERLAACTEHGTHCWSCARHKERRRPAGPWLPVEGESKP